LKLLVLEIGRGRDVEERSLDMREVLKEGDGDRNPVCK